MKRSVKTPQRLERRICFEVKLTGAVPTLVYGKYQGSIVANSTGDYTITLTNPSTQVVQAIGTPYSTSARDLMIKARTASTVEVVITDNNGTVQDTSFCLWVLCNDGTDQY